MFDLNKDSIKLWMYFKCRNKYVYLVADWRMWQLGGMNSLFPLKRAMIIVGVPS